MSSRRRSWHALELPEAEAFERYMVPLLLRPLAERLLEALSPVAGNRLLDLACGTGALAKPALERVGVSGRVAAVDVDAASLAVAHEGSPAAIAYVRATAEQLPFQSASFDSLACQQGLQFFESRDEALSEVRRVLVPAGRVAFSVWAPVDQQPVFGAIRRALSLHVGEDVGNGFFKRPSSLGGDGRLEQVLRSAGFEDVCVRDVEYEARFESILDFLEQYGAATGLGNTLAALTRSRRDAVVGEVATSLPDGRLFVRYRLGTASCG